MAEAGAADRVRWSEVDGVGFVRAIPEDRSGEAGIVRPVGGAT